MNTSLPPSQPSPNATEEKLKPFRLVKYFTFTSLTVMFIGTLILSGLNTHWVRSMLIKNREDYARVLIENLNHQVFMQFVIPVAMTLGKIRLREPDQFARMDKVVRSTLHSFKVESVTIYDLSNIVSYSMDRDRIGMRDLGGSGYRKAVKGEVTTILVQTGNFWEILFGVPADSRIVTLAPLRAEQPLSKISGPVLGVVEVVENVSDDYREIFRLQLLVLGTCILVMGGLFLVLRYTVKRGERIIENRAQERLKLKEELAKARHLSALGEMTAGISHEIRNPLGIIRSSAELLQKKMKRLDAASTIPEIIVTEATRLDTIIQDFLNYARPQVPNRTHCDVDAVIEQNLKFLAPTIDTQGYTIRKHTESGNRKSLPPVWADTDMLYQAFLNLLLNAMQAMPDGGTVGIYLTCDADTVRIRFEDQGTGIPEELVEKIWDPFFTTKDKGTGLGLGIVRNIIDAHQGSIQIQNRQIGGTRVVVKLPIAEG
ncbi:MAG: two-component sensor histidine kinase [Deltaproteobacteria bacterium]|nr:MAG: two-component sensor histidine kinase [Deltaproteobacteria bacterium]